MKLTKFSAILLLTALMLSTVSRSMAQVPRGPQGMQTKTITLDKTAFNQSLSGAVGPKVMGYQYVLIKDGQLVAEKAGGLAQTSKDNGPLQMTTRTPINLGSLQKFITGTALEIDGGFSVGDDAFHPDELNADTGDSDELGNEQRLAR